MNFTNSKSVQDLILTTSQTYKLATLDLTHSIILKTLYIDRLFRSLTLLPPCIFTPNSSSKPVYCNALLVNSGQLEEYSINSKSWSITRGTSWPEKLPNVRLTHQPTLCFIPALCHNCNPCWLIWVDLILTNCSFSIPGEATLRPHLKTTHSSNCWTICKTCFNFVPGQDHSLTLFALGHRNLFHNLSYKAIQIDLYIHLVCGPCKYTLKLLDPLLIDFKSLLTPIPAFYSTMDSLWTKKRDLLSCIFPFTKQWTLQTVCHTIFATLESKLGWNQAIDCRDNEKPQSLNKRKCFFVSGILTGTLLELNLNSSLNAMQLEVWSCSPLSLELVESVLQQLPDTVVQPLTPDNRKNKPQEIGKSNLEQLRDCLVQEVECLIEQTAQLIASTMHKRVPKLPLFLKDMSNNLNIAHRLTEWRTLVEGALSTPIDKVELGTIYVTRRQATDDCLQLLC